MQTTLPLKTPAVEKEDSSTPTTETSQSDQEWTHITTEKVIFNQSKPMETSKDSIGITELREGETTIPGSFINEGLRFRGTSDTIEVLEPLDDAIPLTSSESSPQHQTQQSEEQDDGKICRICFAGEEEPELGRLISPCRCKGTMKYIHSHCLNEWRKKSRKDTSFFQCDQCGYKYRLQRTWWASLIMNEFVISIVTALLFTTLVFFSGFITKLLIRFWVLTDEDWIELERIEKLKDGKRLILEDEWGAGFLSMDLKSLSLTNVDMSHFLSGLALVGFFGALNLMITLFSGPFPRVGGVRVGGYRQGDSNGSGTILMAIFIIVGAARTAWSLYKYVKDLSRRSLEVVESVILDVQE